MKKKSQTKTRWWKNTGTKVPDVVRAASQLGVHRSTLYRALTGRSKSPQLVQRYEALTGKSLTA